MDYLCPRPTEDFTHWRQLGNTGWAWDDVLPYFKRAETWNGDGKVDPVRGTEGPLSVSPTPLKRDIVDKWVDAAVERWLPTQRRL